MTIEPIRQPAPQVTVRQTAPAETTTRSSAPVSRPAEPVAQPVRGTVPESDQAVNTRAQKLDAAAVEKKLTEGLGTLPTHDRMNMRQQAATAAEFVERSPEGALLVARGESLPPRGILPESVYTALEIKAIKTGDVDLIRQLSQSKVPTIAGQSLKALDSVDPNSPVKILRDIQAARETKVAKRDKQGRDAEKLKREEVKAIDTEIKRSVSARPTWEQFLSEITCGY